MPGIPKLLLSFNMKRLAGCLGLAAVLLLVFPTCGTSQQMDDYFERTFRHVALEFLGSVRHVPGMPDHFIAAQQGGQITAFSRNSSWGVRTVMNISDHLLNIADYAESGLLAATPHPRFTTN